MGGSEVLVIEYQNVISSLCARDTKGVGNQYVMEGKVIVETKELKEPTGLDGYNAALTGDKSATLGVNCGMSTGRNGVVMATQQGGAEIRTDGKAPTLTAAAGMSGNNQPVYCDNDFIVRRLIPLECERLQGYPDNWTLIGYPVSEDEYRYTDESGKERKTSDSARYKALGNSIALPPWFYVLTKLSLACGADTTIASLFDGIGGFPLIWEYLNGEGKCLWASEIEDFPIAVTKEHFNNENI